MADRADLRRFRQRPRRRLLVGVVLVFVGLALGWPLVSLCGALAAATADPWYVAVLAPWLYGLSWLVYAAGVVTGGREALRYAADLHRWLTRIAVEGLLGSASIGDGDGSRPLHPRPRRTRAR